MSLQPLRRGHGHPWLTLLCVTFGLVMVGLDNTIVAVANLMATAQDRNLSGRVQSAYVSEASGRIDGDLHKISVPTPRSLTVTPIALSCSQPKHRDGCQCAA